MDAFEYLINCVNVNTPYAKAYNWIIEKFDT